MDTRNTAAGDGTDWADVFNNNQLDDPMGGSSPFGMSAFNDFTTLDAYADSPIGLGLRTPSLSTPAQSGQDVTMANPASAETSSPDSSSESSSRGKLKHAPESPMSDSVADAGFHAAATKAGNRAAAMGEARHMRTFDQTFSRPMHELSLEQGMKPSDGAMAHFDFNSAASSPIPPSDFNAAMSLDPQVMPTATVAGHLGPDSPVQTINPGMFALNTSRDQSPVSNPLMFNQASPTGLFSTTSPESPDRLGGNPSWNPIHQGPAWSSDFKSQMQPSDNLGFASSRPTKDGGRPPATSRSLKDSGISPLHIAPIAAKSRVETQINIFMTLERPHPDVKHLHLPLHTISKTKLLARDEEYDPSTVLELHTMLVCTSAMRKQRLKDKAHKRAAARNNEDIQCRAELARSTGDESRNDIKNLDETEKPINGGEVRICQNCIQRERKRAGRKKTKREEEQEHWERFETERVVVFNSNEYLPFKPYEAVTLPSRDGSHFMEVDPYVPPEGALQVAAAMRIACYCRHQAEKEGFRVIFTMKDHHGKVVAQQMSDSILITDDHKTHPPGFPGPGAADGNAQNSGYSPSGLQMSQSMIDMTKHTHPFTSSKSVGNLAALGFGSHFNSHSHVHQLPNLDTESTTTSATMTPTSLSRPPSPANAAQTGPNKKRKSATFHRKVPSGLTMTPRVDTNQASPSMSIPSAKTMSAQFSPSNPSFSNQFSQPYMALPHSGAAQFFGSGPNTPNEGGPFNFGPSQVDMARIPHNQAYFSHPSSAVPSRSNSPVLAASRGNVAAFARHNPIQTPTNILGAGGALFQGPVTPGSAGSDTIQLPRPVITRIMPREGPLAGGTEIAVFGEQFEIGTRVVFDTQPAATQFLSSTSLIATAPPGHAPGGFVHLYVVPPPNGGPYRAAPAHPVYKYNPPTNEDTMVMALKYLSEQQYGHADAWQSLAQHSATSFVQSRVNPAGIQQQPQQQQQQQSSGGGFGLGSSGGGGGGGNGGGNGGGGF